MDLFLNNFHAFKKKEYIMYKIITCLFAVLIFFSCDNANKHLLTSDFPKKEKLQTEHVIPSTIVAPIFFVIQANYLCTYSLQKDSMIDMFSLPDLIHVKSFGVRGKGPGEFQSFPWPCKSTNNDFYVRGYTPLLIRQFTVDPCVNPILVNEFVLADYESFGPMHVVQDSLLVYLSMGYQNENKEQISIKKYNLNQKKETGKILIPTKSKRNASLDPNRAGGFDVNDLYIVYAYLFKKQIDIYDVHSMKLVCRLERKKNQNPSVNKNFTENISHYQGVITGEKYFFALYNKTVQKISESEPASQTIEVYDYEGNALVEYSFDDYINVFVLDEMNQNLYAYDINQEDFILKYNLKKQ